LLPIHQAAAADGANLSYRVKAEPDFPLGRALWFEQSDARMYWLLLASSLAGAGFVQGLGGFGFGLVSMAVMPLFMPIKEAAVISTAFTLLATIVTFFRHVGDYNWRLGGGFLASVCVGLPLGVYFLERSDEKVLTRLLGGFMVIYATRELVARGNPKSFPPLLTVPLGVFSGAMSGAFNLGGVPGAAYAYAHPWTRGQIMAFLQVMIALSCVLRMILYRQTGLLARISWGPALALALPLYASIWLGHLALQRIDAVQMRRGIFVFIGISGVYYLLIH
jgi:uncharacterized membrane protein YfcA